MNVEEVFEEVIRDRPFYESSHGGVTLSGGEPALAGAFAKEILERCHGGGIHTAIETCGDSPWPSLEALLPWTDLVIMDIKLLSPEKHLRVTGRPNDRILANAKNLAQTERPLLVRTPVVPTVNDDPDEFARIASFVKNLIDIRASGNNQDSGRGEITFELLPFHRLASDKYASLGMEYSAASLDPPPKSTMLALAKIAENLGITTRIR
jgi:pyruvate formate lyase activating enzyme